MCALGDGRSDPASRKEIDVQVGEIHPKVLGLRSIAEATAIRKHDHGISGMLEALTRRRER